MWWKTLFIDHPANTGILSIRGLAINNQCVSMCEFVAVASLMTSSFSFKYMLCFLYSLRRNCKRKRKQIREKEDQHHCLLTAEWPEYSEWTHPLSLVFGYQMSWSCKQKGKSRKLEVNISIFSFIQMIYNQFLVVQFENCGRNMGIAFCQVYPSPGFQVS